jgi:ABC-type transport system involved in multi-copper enzyme maturation permease subunit
LVGARAAISICHEREQSTWDTLLTTTLEPHEIVLAKMAGSLYVLRGLLVVYLLVWYLEVTIDVNAWWRGAGVLATNILLGLFFSALGVLISQRSRTSTRAMCWIVGITILLAGGYLLLALPLAEILLHYHVVPLIFVPCLIFLESFWAWYEPSQNFVEISPLTIYLLGSVLYSVGTVGLILVNVHSFERLAREAAPRRFVLAPTRRAPGYMAPVAVVEKPALKAGEV